MSDRLLFFGNERIATGVTSPVLVLQALLAAGYDIPAIVVAQGETGKSRRERPLEVAAVAETHGIPVVSFPKLKEASQQLLAYGATAGVLMAYGKIVPQETIDIFPKGIINLHPSLLPKHRGPTPLESTILQGDKETGMSLMRLAAKMDAGPVYAQETVLLGGGETKQMLADQLATLGANMLIQYLPDILNGNLQPAEQDESQATYDRKISKQDGELDFHKTAQELAREVRAYAGWPKSHILLAKQDLIITAAHATEGNGMAGTMWLDGKNIGLFCEEGILAFDRLIPPGKKEMTAEAYLAGYTAS